jgi:hypothetical protein
MIYRRGSWRGGPPGSNGPRSNTPVISGPANGPRLSINDQYVSFCLCSPGRSRQG